MLTNEKKNAGGHREETSVDSVDLRKITIGPLAGEPSAEKMIGDLFAGTNIRLLTNRT